MWFVCAVAIYFIVWRIYYHIVGQPSHSRFCKCGHYIDDHEESLKELCLVCTCEEFRPQW